MFRAENELTLCKYSEYKVWRNAIVTERQQPDGKQGHPKRTFPGW